MGWRNGGYVFGVGISAYDRGRGGERGEEVVLIGEGEHGVGEVACGVGSGVAAVIQGGSF